MNIVTHTGTNAPDSRWRWVGAVAVAVSLGVVAAWWAAAQFDTGPGDELTFGFWAAVSGTLATVLGLGVGARGRFGLWTVTGVAVVIAGAAAFLAWASA
jgi:hypothetical protein